MQITFDLCLPRDEASVPVVRHLCRDALSMLGVKKDCLSDIEIAVTEACSNVLNHAAGTESEYAVSVEVSALQCDIRIKDTGGGFDHGATGLESSVLSAEGGRGIFLMRTLVDELRFASGSENGTVVHLTKQLDIGEDSPLMILEKSSKAQG